MTESESSRHYIGVSKGKFNKLSAYAWGENEHPIFLDAIYYRLPNQRLNSKGYLMITRGAVYIFRYRALKGPMLLMHINLLHCTGVEVSKHLIAIYAPKLELQSAFPDGENQAELDVPLPILFDEPDNNIRTVTAKKKGVKLNDPNQEYDFRILIDSSFAPQIGKIIFDIVKCVVFKLQKCVYPRLAANVIQDYKLQKPCKHSLKRRAIFLAHYSFTSGTGLDCADYFSTKWDGSKRLVIGKSFKPGDYAAPFGCAVGWEVSLDRVVFQGVSFNRMNQFIDALVASSHTINEMVFTNYNRGTVPQFEFKRIITTIVSNWKFVNCAAQAVLSFTQVSGRLPNPLLHFKIARCCLNQSDSISLFKSIGTNLKTVSLNFVSISFHTFPSNDFIRMLSSISTLETLELRKINIDGFTLLKLICQANTNIKSLLLKGLDFDTPDCDITLPEKLLLLDVSQSNFIGNGLTNFFNVILHSKTQNPFILRAQSIVVSDTALRQFKHVGDGVTFQPNIWAFDFSSNNISKNVIKGLDKILLTQTRLRYLVFEKVTTDSARNLMQTLSSVMSKMGFEGLDLSGQFESYFIQQLIISLCDCKRLKRLSLKNSCGGNECIASLTTLLESFLPRLEELQCDGMRPSRVPVKHGDRQPVTLLWMTIAKRTTIKANDLPKSDFSELGVSFDRISMKDRKWFSKLENRERPLTFEERISKVFEKAASYAENPFLEDGDEELKEEVSENEQDLPLEVEKKQIESSDLESISTELSELSSGDFGSLTSDSLDGSDLSSLDDFDGPIKIDGNIYNKQVQNDIEEY